MSKKKASKKKEASKFANKSSFQIGNSEWEKRNIHGRKPIFDNAQELWDACVGYFEWIEKNPLKSQETVKYQGVGSTMEVDRMRAMTIKDLCNHLNMDQSTWEDYRAKPDFSRVTARVDSIIFTQKFQGAAAGLLEQNIIARELGLADKKEHAHSGAILQEATEEMSFDEARRIYQDNMRVDEGRK